MKVVYTEKSIESLNETLQFLIEKQNYTFEQASKITIQLLDKADGIVEHPFSGQKEEYLTHLKKDHRRIVDGHFKLYTVWIIISSMLQIFLIRVRKKDSCTLPVCSWPLYPVTCILPASFPQFFDAELVSFLRILTNCLAIEI